MSTSQYTAILQMIIFWIHRDFDLVETNKRFSICRSSICVGHCGMRSIYWRQHRRRPVARAEVGSSGRTALADAGEGGRTWAHG